MLSKAGMGPRTEREMREPVAIDPKALRFVKHALVVVGRKI